VVELRDKLIAATMDVYSTVAAQLLPTPTKSHYIFNLRDFSRVVQGVQMQDVRSLASGAAASGAAPTAQHTKLWCHEVGVLRPAALTLPSSSRLTAGTACPRAVRPLHSC
jgi:dynein heavy chain